MVKNCLNNRNVTAKFWLFYFEIMSHTSIQKLLVFSSVLIFLAACSVERKIANTFVSNKNKGAVLVLSPDAIFQLNNYDSINPNNIDSTFFLKKIDKYALIGLSLEHLKDELKKMGFNVYDETTLAQFMTEGDSSYVLKLSQVELEEGLDSINFSDHFDVGYDVEKYIKIKYFSINSWFEFARKNILDEEFPLLYCSFSLSDNVYGDYNSYGGGLFYGYTIDSLTLQDFSGLPEKLGEKYASYFYDYIMNIYILENLPKDFIPTYYYHFDPYSKMIIRGNDDHFIEMDECLFVR